MISILARTVVAVAGALVGYRVAHEILGTEEQSGEWMELLARKERLRRLLEEVRSKNPTPL